MTKAAALSNAKEILINYLAAASLLLLGFGFYTYYPYFVAFFSDQARDLFVYFVVAYLVLLPFFYSTLPPGYVTKCRLFWQAVINCLRRPLTRPEKVALLAVAVKFFFLPLMIAWLFNHARETLINFENLISTGAFFPTGYWLLFNIIFLVDVGCFTIGYAIEHPRLDNEIRSVEPTAFGWIVTLICYPPFNNATQQMLGWHSSDYPNFDSPFAQYLSAGAILLALAIYAWASAALNLKASNLTHRGIVDKGPYAWVRHPAYIAKNFSWWIGSLPILYAYAQSSASQFVYGVLGVLGWTTIYYLRAITEERHLGMDPEYRRYCERVKYKFIPGVW